MFKYPVLQVYRLTVTLWHIYFSWGKYIFPDWLASGCNRLVTLVAKRNMVLHQNSPYDFFG